MRRALLLVVTCTALFAAGSLGAAQTPALDRLDDYVTTAMDAWQMPGLAVAVVKDGRVVVAKGYGVREIGTSDRVDENTLFAIGSTSKAFTAALIGMLVDEGKASWDDPVIDHLSEFRVWEDYATREMRLRDLLSHRSGLSRGDMLWYGSTFTRDEIVHRVRYLRPTYSFRANYHYQNIMFLTAGEVIETVTGQTWDEVVDARIFTPLGMDRTNTSIDDLDGDANVARPHELYDGVVTAIPYLDIDNIAPAGSINSSVREMAEWLRLQLGDGEIDGERLLSTDAVAEMRTPHTIIPVGQGTRRSYPFTNFMLYGLGWQLIDHRGHMIAQHGGGIDGMRAHVALVPEQALGVVVLSNRGGTNLVPALAMWVIDAYLGHTDHDWSGVFLAQATEGAARAEAAGREREQARVTGTSPSLRADAYAGTYENEMYGQAVVEEGAKGLTLTFSPKRVADLEHWHFDTFKAVWRHERMGESMVTFTLDADGKVAEMLVPMEGPTPTGFVPSAH